VNINLKEIHDYCYILIIISISLAVYANQLIKKFNNTIDDE
jgi:hypothetical protein